MNVTYEKKDAICFDCPLTESGSESHRNRELAAAAGEPMKAKYSYSQMEALLSEAGFLIYEHMNAAEATKAFFQEYNHKNAEHVMTAPEGVGYCLAVKNNLLTEEDIYMNEYIAYCGLDCEACEARLATVNNDNELRQRVAREWSELNGVEITAEMINCSGCRIPGVKTPYCDSLCPIRKCAIDKQMETCGSCQEMNSCEKLAMITGNNADALRRLEEGCSVVEMECAALAACARKRGASFGQFLFTADSLANVHEYDARDFGMESHEKALLLGLDILKNYRRE